MHHDVFPGKGKRPRGSDQGANNNNRHNGGHNQRGGGGHNGNRGANNGQLGMTYMIAFGEWYIRHGAPAFVPRIKIIMEELAGMPETTMGSYWPKISRLTQYVVRQRIVTEAERDARIAANEENPRSHGAELQQPYDKIINSTDYLEFINAVEHGHISLRLTAQELAEMRTAGSDVYLDANGHDEAVEKLTLIGSNEFVHKPLGNSNMKQWGSAAGHLQQV
ncbi:hypothetical protein WJX79_005349 [Trebouxia sp. C0005]